MKITNLNFNDAETAALYALAGATLMAQEMPQEQILAYVETLTPQNVLRLALGSAFPVRHRGGARPNTGNRNPKEARSASAKAGQRGGRKKQESPGPSPLRRRR